MMRFDLNIAFAMSMMVYPLAGWSQDSLRTHVLKEVTVVSENHKAITDGVEYIPTPEERRRSADPYTLLSRMMMPGLKVDVIDKTIKTVYREDVHVFIDGAEAKDWELKSIRPKEVACVRFLQSPSDPRYKGYTSVVDFILRKYDYGGYVALEGMQNFIYNVGDYDMVMKLRKQKMTYRAIAEATYNHVEDIVNNSNTTYTYLDGHLLNRKAWSDSEDKQQSYIGGFSMRYDGNKLIWMLQTGLRYGRKPTNVTSSRLLYNDETASESKDEASAHSLVPYATYSFRIKELPRGSQLIGYLSFSYNHNRSNSRYRYGDLLAKNIFNGYSEDAYLPSVSLTYNAPLYKKNDLTAIVSYDTEYYRTQYCGTNGTFQRLNNSYWNFYLRYNHKFSNSWNGSFIAYVPVQRYKVNDLSTKTTPYVNGSLTISGRIGSKHSFYIRGNITQTDIVPSYYNSVVRQDNEVEGSRGNSELKTVRQAFALLSYTWMPTNNFSLNASFSWDNIIHDIVPYWHEIDGLMVKEMINSGDFNPIYFHITPSLSLLNSKLKINSEVSYVHEWHNGIFRVNNGYFGWYPSVYCDIAKNWTANVSYGISSGYGYMRGSSQMSKFSDNLRLGVQYSKGNLFVKLQVNSLLRNDGWVKTYLNSEYYSYNRYLSRPSDGRYLSLTATYTFDFGKKINHGDNMGFDGTRKSSAL